MQAIQEGYVDVLMRYNWAWFMTLTFRPSHTGQSGGMHPEKADKCFRVLLSKINRSIWGPNWHKHHHKQVVWARGQEFHKSGRIHFHAVAGAPGGDLNAMTRRMDWVDYWWREFGIARIERPKDVEQVSKYISKYVVKDGEVDFSPNFGIIAPGQLMFPTRREGVPALIAAMHDPDRAAPVAATRSGGHGASVA